MHIRYGDTGYNVDYIQSFLKENYSDSVIVSGIYDKSTHNNLINYLELPSIKSVSDLYEDIISRFSDIMNYFFISRDNSKIEFESIATNNSTVEYMILIYNDITDIVNSAGWEITRYTNYKFSDIEKYRITISKKRENKIPSNELLSMVNKFDGTYHYNYYINQSNNQIIYSTNCGYKLAMIPCLPNTSYTICHGYNNIIQISVCSYTYSEIVDMRPVTNYATAYLTKTGKFVYTTNNTAKFLLVQVPYVISNNSSYSLRLLLGDCNLDNKLDYSDINTLNIYLNNPVYPIIETSITDSNTQTIDNPIQLYQSNFVITDTTSSSSITVSNIGDNRIYGISNSKDSVNLFTGKVIRKTANEVLDCSARICTEDNYEIILDGLDNEESLLLTVYPDASYDDISDSYVIPISGNRSKINSDIASTHFKRSQIDIDTNNNILIHSDSLPSTVVDVTTFKEWVYELYTNDSIIEFLYEIINPVTISTELIMSISPVNGTNAITISGTGNYVGASYYNSLSYELIVKEPQLNSISVNMTILTSSDMLPQQLLTMDVNQDGIIDELDLPALYSIVENQTMTYINSSATINSDTSENTLLVTYGSYSDNICVPFSEYNSALWMINDKFMSYILGINITTYSKINDISYLHNLINKIYPRLDLGQSGIYTEELKDTIKAIQMSNKIQYSLGYLDIETEKLLLEETEV